MADTMRQSIRLGLPDLVSQLTPHPARSFQPLTKAEGPALFPKKPDPDFERVGGALLDLASSRS